MIPPSFYSHGQGWAIMTAITGLFLTVFFMGVAHGAEDARTGEALVISGDASPGLDAHA
jgi:hypothetical protein